MAYNTFKLKDKSEILRFDKYLKQYLEKRAKPLTLHDLSLIMVFDLLQNRSDRSKVFASFLDIKINLILIYTDISDLCNSYNTNFAKGKLEGGTILDSHNKFLGKMDVHRHYTSFIFRYRAMWDKIMGFLILYFTPDKYEKFFKSKSRKKEFKKISKEINELPNSFVNKLDNLLSDFDSKFRTPEAHGTGSLRKYSLSMDTFNKNPQIEIINYWNTLFELIIIVGKFLKLNLIIKNKPN